MGMINAGYDFKKLNIAVGANVKVFYNYVPEALYEGQSYILFAGDIGIISRTNILKTFLGPEPSLTIGMAVKNIGYSEFMEKLPTELHFGLSYRVIRNLLITGETVVPLYEPISGSVGLEFDIAKTFFLQGGIQIVENPMVGVGFGYRRTKSREVVKEVERLMVEALQYFKNNDNEKSLANIEKILELDPRNRRARSLKKIIYQESELDGNK
jgi:hypothetical protein